MNLVERAKNIIMTPKQEWQVIDVEPLENMPQAIKVAAYSATPQWIAGIFGLIPALLVLVMIAALYSLYLFYLGLPVLMKVPQEKAMVYTVVVIVAVIVLFLVVGAMTTRMAY